MHQSLFAGVKAPLRIAFYIVDGNVSRENQSFKKVGIRVLKGGETSIRRKDESCPISKRVTIGGGFADSEKWVEKRRNRKEWKEKWKQQKREEDEEKKKVREERRLIPGMEWKKLQRGFARKLRRLRGTEGLASGRMKKTVYYSYSLFFIIKKIIFYDKTL